MINAVKGRAEIQKGQQRYFLVIGGDQGI